MTILNMALVAEALKEFYLPGLRYQLNDESSLFLAQLERNSESVEGRNIVMALRFGRQGGVGNRADDGDLPTPSSRQARQAKWETKNLTARIQLTDKTIQASRGSAGAFANLLQQEIEDCETDIKQDISRQIVGDGTGLLATVTVVAANVLTVDTAMFLAEGMRVDAFNVNTLRRANMVISAVNDSSSPQTITVDNATSVVAGDRLFINGAKDLELTGLAAVFEATTIYGLSRAAVPVLNAQRRNIAGEISEVRIQTAIDESELRAGGKTNFLYCSYGVRRAYQNLLTLQKRLVDTLDLKGGWKALSYNGIPLAADKYIRSGRMMCLDLNDWKLYHMGDFEWMNQDGAVLSRVSGKAAYEATLLRYCDIGCQKPRGQVELFGIAEH